MAFVSAGSSCTAAGFPARQRRRNLDHLEPAEIKAACGLAPLPSQSRLRPTDRRASLMHLLVRSRHCPIAPMLNRPRDRLILATVLALVALAGRS